MTYSSGSVKVNLQQQPAFNAPSYHEAPYNHPYLKQSTERIGNLGDRG